MMSISRHFAEKERNRESQTLSPAVPAAIADVGDARPTPENGKVGPPRRQAGGATGRGPRGHLGGADGDGGDHGQGALARAADGCSLGRAAVGRALAGAGGHPAPKLEIPEAVHKIYPDLSHAQDWEAAIDATSVVSDEVVAQLCDALGLIGAPGDCAGRIAEMAKLGVRNLYLMPTLTFGPPEQEIAAFRDVVFPRLREAGLK